MIIPTIYWRCDSCTGLGYTHEGALCVCPDVLIWYVGFAIALCCIWVAWWFARRPDNNTPTNRQDAITILKKHIAWGKEVDRNRLFDYDAIGKMIEDAEEKARDDNK